MSSSPASQRPVTDPREQYDTLLVIDAAQEEVWGRQVFEQWHTGGLACVVASFLAWENARQALDLLAEWPRLFRTCADLVTPAVSASDIRAAKNAGKVAVLFEFQNTSPLEENLDFVGLFNELGIKIMQLTYNNQNAAGSGCYETSDGGLTRWGRELVREMNTVGVLVDLSHVGERTSLEAIDFSRRPVSMTHANPSSFTGKTALWQRTKSDATLKALAARGGVVGLAAYPNMLKGGRDATLEEFSEMVAYTADLVGIDHVGIGSDLHWSVSVEHLQWVRSGRWTRDVPHIEPNSWDLDWLKSSEDFPHLFDALRARGCSVEEIGAVMGGNWLRLYEESFDPE